MDTVRFKTEDGSNVTLWMVDSVKTRRRRRRGKKPEREKK